MRTIIIGDVHGCLHELKQLLDVIQPVCDDRLCFLGDLVDRGHDSIGVVRLVRKLLAAHPGSVCIMGNHEEKALRYRDRGRSLPVWSDKASAEDWAFLAGLPLIHRLPEYDAVLVHGGFFPAFFNSYGRLGEVPVDWRTANGKHAERLRRFLRIRRVNDKGNMVSLLQTKATDQRWAELYDGREGFAFYGHDAVINPAKPVLDKHAMNLDTGCCYGGRLSAAVLTPGVKPEQAEIASVPANNTYADYLQCKMED